MWNRLLAPLPWEISAILHRTRWCMQSIRTLVSCPSRTQIFSSGPFRSTSLPAASLMPMMLQQLPLNPGSRMLPVVRDLLHCLNVKTQRLASSVDPKPNGILGRLSWVCHNRTYTTERRLTICLLVNEFILQVGLRRVGMSTAFCGGSIISQTRILTAAHCVNTWDNLFLFRSNLFGSIMILIHCWLQLF